MCFQPYLWVFYQKLCNDFSRNYHWDFRILKRTRFLGRKVIKTKQWKLQRHRRHIERRSLFANSIINLYTKCLPKNSYQESVHYTSVALCAVDTSVTLHYLRPLRDAVCPLYKTFSLSFHISEEP